MFVCIHIYIYIHTYIYIKTHSLLQVSVSAYFQIVTSDSNGEISSFTVCFQRLI